MSSVKVSALTEITSTTGSEELLINDGGTSKKIQVSNLPDTDTTYSNFAGTTAGLVPTSTTGDDTKFLRADGTWVVPTDTDTTYSTATATTEGLVKIEDNAAQTIAANTVTATASRTYGVQLNASDQAVVNVPWTDTDTGITDVVDDTSPQLGGNLDFQTHKATSFTSTGIDDNATSTAITIDASENVGIGTITPDGKLHIDGTSTTVTGLVLEAGMDGDCRSVDFHNSDGNKRMGIVYDNTNIKLNITDRSENKLVTIGELTGDVTVGTGNLVIGTSGKGIDFSAATPDGSGTTGSEVLDDYEEGTFTVGWVSTGNTFTPNTTTGYYTKVGNLVTVTYAAYMAGAPTIVTSGNGVTFTGLPFASGSMKNTAFTWGHHRWNEFPAGTNGFSLEQGATTSTLIPRFRTGIGELATGTALVWSRNGSGIVFEGHYYV